MTHSTISRTLATIACTLLFSGMATLGAVGPAQGGANMVATTRTA